MNIPRCSVVLLLLCAVFARAESPITVTICAPQVVNVATTRSFGVEIKVFGTDPYDDQITLSTDVGHFPSGEKFLALSLKEPGALQKRPLIILDSLEQLATADTMKIWATHGDDTLYTANVALRRVQSITWLNTPNIKSNTYPLPAIAHAVIRDQYGDGLVGVPAYLRYRVPGAPPGVITGVTDAKGYLTFHVPAPAKECDITCQIMTESVSSDTLTIPCKPPYGALRASLPYHVVFTMPSEVHLHNNTSTVPVLVSISGDGQLPLPETIHLELSRGSFANGHSRQAISLQDGLGTAMITLQGYADRKRSFVNIYAMTCDADGKPTPTGIIGMTDMRLVDTACSLDLEISPTPHPDYPGSVGTLTCSPRDEWGDRMVDVPTQFSEQRRGVVKETTIFGNTNSQGSISFPILPPVINDPDAHDIYGSCYVSAGGFSVSYSILHDLQGRLIGYGPEDKITKRFTYDQNGKPIMQE